MKIIRKVPPSLVALFLALLTCGNLLRSYGSGLRLGLGLLACCLLGLVLARILLDWPNFKSELDQPLVASVIPALSMGLMVLAGYLIELNYLAAKTLYLTGFILHLVLMALFSRKFLKAFTLSQVYPSWFIVYVGIATAGIVAPSFQLEALGRLSFYFGALSYLVLMPINIYRFTIIKDLKEDNWPSIGVFCSPASLSLAAYVNSFQDHRLPVLLVLMTLSQLAYFFVVSRLPKLLESNFYPSFASFTFPMAVSGLALKMSQSLLLELGHQAEFLTYLVKLEEALALFIIAYVLTRYGSFILDRDLRGSQTFIKGDWDLD